MSQAKHELIVTRMIKATKESVWEAWERPHLFEKWFTPSPVRTASNVHQFFPGGAFDCTITLPDRTEFRSEGCFLETRKHSRIVFTDCLSGGWQPNEESFFTLIFNIEEEGPELVVTVTALHKNEDGRQKHMDMNFNRGWRTVLGQLEQVAQETRRRPTA